MDLRACGDAECYEYASDRGVDTRLQEECPDGDTCDDIGLKSGDAQATEEEEKGDECETNTQGQE